MPLLTQFGSPWGNVPQTSGKYIFVAPSGQYTVEGQSYSASDNNDGLRPDRAVRTVNQAITLATASVGDVIILLPGAHSVSSKVNINKAGLTITGLPGTLPTAKQRRSSTAKSTRTTITSTETPSSTLGTIFEVNAPDTEIAFITFLPAAAGGRGISLTPTLALANRAYIHDCVFKLQATASTTTFGVTVPANVTADILDEALISNCYFVSGTDTTSGANGNAVNVLGTAHGLTLEQSTFELKGTAAWASVILSSNPGSLGNVIRDCDFIAPTSATTVMTAVIDTTGATVDGSHIVYRCYFPIVGTSHLKSTASADILVADSFQATATGASTTATKL